MFVHLGVWSETVGAVCERMGFLCMDGCVCARVSLCPCPSLLCLCPLIHQDSLSLSLSLSARNARRGRAAQAHESAPTSDTAVTACDTAVTASDSAETACRRGAPTSPRGMW